MTLDFWIQVVSLHGLRKILLLFFITGWVVFYVDYKKLEQPSNAKREAKFTRIAAMIYIVGSALSLVAVQMFNWVV